MPALSTKSLIGIILICCVLKQIQANVLFRFALDFHVKDNGTELLNKTIKVENNQLLVQNNEEENSTSAPGTEEQTHGDVAKQLLKECKLGVQLLNAELTPLAGRSNQMAGILKQTIRYANEVDASLISGNMSQHFGLLRKYLSLVDNWRSPNNSGGERTLEFVVLKLAMEKYGIVSKQQEALEYLQRADRAWNNYRKHNVILSES
ncbi:CG9837 [Drosophila busckii]|uniref:CG9837 n=1 Tax=Drosophila busckii TaxID=30019 RepID=A0A0M5J2B9_DROBS|nr:uncharacterized protein LOC108604596 [Drosophila busckii]ALC47498.1 CG9837 [Drosophila busckii]